MSAVEVIRDFYMDPREEVNQATMRASEAILRYIKAHKVDYVFGIPAGTVSPIFDSMNDVNIRPIVTKNEAGAAYMAARYAGVTGKLGVCVVAGGVGANNMVNGVADAMRAKSPVLILSGYVNRKFIGKGALQELDTQDIFRSITKYSHTVLDEKELMNELKRAIRIALTPPMGPVHLQIPLDLQLSTIAEPMPHQVQYSFINYIQPNTEKIMNACEVINESSGIIMVGKGCRGMTEQVCALSEHLQWPIITTPEAMGVIPADYPNNLGTYGYSGTDTAYQYVDQGPATCVLVLGSSLGECSTCNFSDILVKGRKLIHVDWDVKELGKVYKTDIKILGDLSTVIPQIMKNTRKSDIPFERKKVIVPYQGGHTGISLRLFFEKVTELLPADTYYACDLGEYMNFVFKYLSIPQGGNFEINLNYAAMGSGIAGALGIQVAYPDRPVAVFAGDGSFFMNGSEILTAKEYGLPIIYFVINNAMLGYVEHGHTFLYGRVLERFRQERISIANMMEAAGVTSLCIEKMEDLDKIPPLVSNLNGPCVIELVTDGSEPAPIMDRLKALKK